MVRQGIERQIKNELGDGPAVESVDISGVGSRSDDITEMLVRIDSRLDLLEGDDDLECIAC